MFLDYTYGVNKIYTVEEIDKAKTIALLPSRVRATISGTDRKCVLTTKYRECHENTA
jgi:hypothetical protein